MSEFHIGQKVFLRIPNNANPGSRELRQFNNKVYRVHRVHYVKKLNDTMFILTGVKSKMGMPFFVAKEWITAID